MQARGEHLTALDGQHGPDHACFRLAGVKSLPPALGYQRFEGCQHVRKSLFDYDRIFILPHEHGQHLQADTALFQALHRHIQLIRAATGDLVERIRVGIADYHKASLRISRCDCRVGLLLDALWGWP